MRRTILAAVLISLAACGGKPSESKGSLKDVVLTRLGGGEPVALEKCAAAKCLTVVVAPWCPYCRQNTAMIRALRDYLKKHNVATRVVVAKDEDAALRAYAQEFGPDSLLDPKGAISVTGVPYFMVSDRQGGVINAVAGAPGGVTEPYNDETMMRVAKLFELP